jgi:phasin family protein
VKHSFEDVDAVGRELLDSGLESFAAVSKGVQAITVNATEYARKTCAEGGAALRKLATAKSPEALVDMQSGYARSAYQSLIAESTRLLERYAELARDAYQPFERMGARTK